LHRCIWLDQKCLEKLVSLVPSRACILSAFSCWKSFLGLCNPFDSCKLTSCSFCGSFPCRSIQGIGAIICYQIPERRCCKTSCLVNLGQSNLLSACVVRALKIHDSRISWTNGSIHFPSIGFWLWFRLELDYVHLLLEMRCNQQIKQSKKKVIFCLQGVERIDKSVVANTMKHLPEVWSLLHRLARSINTSIVFYKSAIFYL